MSKPTAPEPVLDLWSWQDRSACRGMETELFFAVDFARGAPKRAHEAAAKAVCATCPVLAECQTWALAFHEPHGIWGGLTPEERDAQRASEPSWPNAKAGSVLRWALADEIPPAA